MLLISTSNIVQFGNVLDSWLKYDFGDLKVRPTHYSIRTMHSSNSYHIRNWVNENLNTDNENYWKQLDSPQNDSFLNGLNFTHTYNISMQLGQRDFHHQFFQGFGTLCILLFVLSDDCKCGGIDLIFWVDCLHVLLDFSLICGSIDFLSMDIFSHLWNADSSIWVTKKQIFFLKIRILKKLHSQ